jgi:hypothetical protein
MHGSMNIKIINSYPSFPILCIILILLNISFHFLLERGQECQTLELEVLKPNKAVTKNCRTLTVITCLNTANNASVCIRILFLKQYEELCEAGEKC